MFEGIGAGPSALNIQNILVNCVLLISHPDYHVKNLESVVRILLDNDYSLQFIFSTIAERLKTLANKKI